MHLEGPSSDCLECFCDKDSGYCFVRCKRPCSGNHLCSRYFILTGLEARRVACALIQDGKRSHVVEEKQVTVNKDDFLLFSLRTRWVNGHRPLISPNCCFHKSTQRIE
jgi:hypothetical protein